MTTTQARAVATARAKHQLAHLADHPATTTVQLGNARDLLNQMHNRTAADTQDCIQDLEQIVTDVYDGHPDCEHVHCSH